MRIALISDIHGNRWALAAVLDHIVPPARLIACGHTHVPRLVQTAAGCTIVNPGSVGLPAYEDDHPMAPPEQPAVYYVETGSPHAAYAIVEDTDPGWEVSFHRVAY